MGKSKVVKTTKKSKNSVLTHLLPLVRNSVQDWSDRNNREHIHNHVFNYLNGYRDKIINAMLGFNEEWGKVKIDMTTVTSVDSNRKREFKYPIARLLMAKINTAAEAWIDKEEIPDLTDRAHRQIQSTYRTEYLKELKSRVTYLAQENANDDAEKVFEALLDTTEIDNFILLTTSMKSDD